MSDKRLKMQSATAQVVLQYQTPDGIAENVLYFEHQNRPTEIEDWGATTFADDTAEKLLSLIGPAWASHVASWTSDNVSLLGAELTWNEAVDAGPLHEYNGASGDYPQGGSLAADRLPGNCTVAIKLGTGLGGRSYHGRFYFVGLTRAHLQGDVGSNLDPSIWGDTMSGINAWMDAVQAPYGEPFLLDRFVLQVCSFIFHGALRTPALTTSVRTLTNTDLFVDSQRRRLPGRGV